MIIWTQEKWYVDGNYQHTGFEKRKTYKVTFFSSSLTLFWESDYKLFGFIKQYMGIKSIKENYNRYMIKIICM